MTRSTPTLLCLALGFFLIASISEAAREPVKGRVISPSINRSLQYSFPTDDPIPTDAEAATSARTALRSSATLSPGVAIGDTWYDKQHNGTMGRMVRVGTSGSPDTSRVHLSWMWLGGPSMSGPRSFQYNSFNLTSGAMGTPLNLQADPDRGGYVNLDVTNDGRAIVGGHVNLTGLQSPTFYWDSTAGGGNFWYYDAVPQAQQDYPSESGQEAIWPKFAYVEGASDTVLHVFAQVSAYPGDPQAIYYFRRVGGEGTGTWDYPPYVVDTIFTLSGDIAANDDGKVALGWLANPPCAPGDPDTASCNSGYTPTHTVTVQRTNDLYYQISNDYGLTWEPRVNVTNDRYKEAAQEDHFKAYTDMSVLLDSDGDLHIAWSANLFQYDPLDIPFDTRLFHWSEDQPTVRAAHTVSPDPALVQCIGGAWNLEIAKMSISECNGRFYILFVQFNDPAAGIYDDCAGPNVPGAPNSSANGELYVVVSEDNGLTWDKARNLTNSRTPGCDSTGGAGGPCDSDVWPSMSPYGSNVPSSGTDIVIPAGGADNGWYLDVQYINDHSAGAIVSNEGFWNVSDVRWFRMACAEAVKVAEVVFSPTEIAYPEWVRADRIYNRQITIENSGNDAYTYALTEEETGGGLSGWLSTSGFSGTVGFGVSNTEAGTVTVDPIAAGASLGQIYVLTGRVIFTGNSPSSPDTIPISIVVADTLYPTEIDTITTNCLSLVVANDGSAGSNGVGSVNMDYTDGTDCDPNANVYLNTSSPIVGWVNGSDTAMYWSAYSGGYSSPYGFRPVSNSESVAGANYETYQATFMTPDSSITIEKTWYAPNAACNFIIQVLRVYATDGGAVAGLTVGEVVDWDVPSDSGANNGSGFDEIRRLLWQYGGEYHQDDTGINVACLDSDRRWAGMRHLCMGTDDGWTVSGSLTPYGAYTADNASYVYGNPYGFEANELFAKMQQSSGWSQFEPAGTFVDLHSVMTYVQDFDLAAGKELVVINALITAYDTDEAGFKAIADAAWLWPEAQDFWPCVPLQPICCCDLRGDLDISGAVNVADLTFLVGYLFKAGEGPACPAPGESEGDVDGNGAVNVGDLTYLVNYLFKGGAVPVVCPSC